MSTTYQAGKIIEFTTNLGASSPITTFKFRNDLYDVLSGKGLSADRALLYQGISFDVTSLPLVSDQTHKVRLCLNARGQISVIQQVILIRGTQRTVIPAEVPMSSDTREIVYAMIKRFSDEFIDYIITQAIPSNICASAGYHSETSFDFAVNVCNLCYAIYAYASSCDLDIRRGGIVSLLTFMRKCSPKVIVCFISKFDSLAKGVFELSEVTNGDLPLPYEYDNSKDQLSTTNVLNIKTTFKPEQCAFFIAPTFVRTEGGMQFLD
nr:MAG: hypothetical protein [Reoviridae sp.]